MSLEVGFPRGGTLLRDQNLEDVYRQMSIINRDFFRNVQSCIRYLQKQQQFRLNKYDEIFRYAHAIYKLLVYSFKSAKFDLVWVVCVVIVKTMR